MWNGLFLRNLRSSEVEEVALCLSTWVLNVCWWSFLFPFCNLTFIVVGFKKSSLTCYFWTVKIIYIYLFCPGCPKLQCDAERRWYQKSLLMALSSDAFRYVSWNGYHSASLIPILVLCHQNTKNNTNAFILSYLNSPYSSLCHYYRSVFVWECFSSFSRLRKDRTNEILIPDITGYFWIEASGGQWYNIEVSSWGVLLCTWMYKRGGGKAHQATADHLPAVLANQGGARQLEGGRCNAYLQKGSEVESRERQACQPDLVAEEAHGDLLEYPSHGMYRGSRGSDPWVCKKHNCPTQSPSITWWASLWMRESPGMLTLDFRKVFDTVSHIILLETPAACGFNALFSNFKTGWWPGRESADEWSYLQQAGGH